MTLFPMLFTLTILSTVLTALLGLGETAQGQEHPGLQLLKNRQYNPPTLPLEVFKSVWMAWEPELREQASRLSPEDRWEMIKKRYGFATAPYENGGFPLGFTGNDEAVGAFNCLLCHGGQVGSSPGIIGLGSNRLNMVSLQEDLTILEALQRGETLERPVTLDSPFQHTSGTTFAFDFSAQFLSFRTPNLDLMENPVDMGGFFAGELDPPALWNLSQKTHFYVDGFAQATPRALMQFTLTPPFSGELIRSWEDDFVAIFDYLQTLEPPAYPRAIDESVASEGRTLFNENCASCHGTYNNGEVQNAMTEPLLVGTDTLRTNGMTTEFKTYYNEGWLGYFGETEGRSDSGNGYLPPVLRGVWATAPYFHNGSVPTLSHLLLLEPRPTQWMITEADEYDLENVGVRIETDNEVLAQLPYYFQKRRVQDSSQPGASNAGHEFVDQISVENRRKILEYLKTL